MRRLYWLLGYVLISLVGYGCLAKPARNKNSFPENITRIMHYFDSSRIREFDSVRFHIGTETNKYKWTFIRGDIIAFEYSAGWGTAIPQQRDVKDSVERFWVSDEAYFNSLFPLSISLPAWNLEILKSHSNLITVKSDWIHGVTNDDTIFYDALKPEKLFLERNAFTHMIRHNQLMDSLGIGSIASQFGTNIVLIALRSGQEFLFHRPDRVTGDSRQINYLDSILTIGKKVDQHWTYFDGPLKKNNKSNK